LIVAQVHSAIRAKAERIAPGIGDKLVVCSIPAWDAPKSTQPEPQPTQPIEQPKATISLEEMAGVWGYVPTKRSKRPRAARAAKSEPQATEAQPEPTEAIEQYIVVREYNWGACTVVYRDGDYMLVPLAEAIEYANAAPTDKADTYALHVVPANAWYARDYAKSDLAEAKRLAVHSALGPGGIKATEAIEIPALAPKPKRSPKPRPKKDRHILVSKAQPREPELVITTNGPSLEYLFSVPARAISAF